MLLKENRFLRLKSYTGRKKLAPILTISFKDVEAENGEMRSKESEGAVQNIVEIQPGVPQCNLA